MRFRDARECYVDGGRNLKLSRAEIASLIRAARQERRDKAPILLAGQSVDRPIRKTVRGQNYAAHWCSPRAQDRPVLATNACHHHREPARWRSGSELAARRAGKPDRARPTKARLLALERRQRSARPHFSGGETVC